MIKGNITVTDINYVIYVNNTNFSEMRDYSGKILHNELIFKLDGSSKIVFDRYTFIDSPSSVRFLPKSEVYKKYTAETLENGSCIDIFFDTAEPINCEPFLLNCKNNEKLAVLFKKAELVWRKKQAGYKYTAMGYLYEILGLLEYGETYTPNSKINKIKPGIDYITEHYTENINVEEIAKMCNISHTYFKKIFSGIYGTAPKSYVIDLRIRYACDLLKSQMHSVGEAAELSGFQNVYYFSRCFKKIMGISPSEYKKFNSEKL